MTLFDTFLILVFSMPVIITIATIGAFVVAHFTTIALATLATSAAVGIIIEVGSVAQQKLKEKHAQRYSKYHSRFYSPTGCHREQAVYNTLLEKLHENVNHKSVKNSYWMQYQNNSYLLIADIVCYRDKKRKSNHSMTKVRFWINPENGHIKMFCKRTKELNTWEERFVDNSLDGYFSGCK